MSVAAVAGTVASDRLVFVAGLHRSGTTPLARWLAEHPDIAGLRDTGVPEDEGQHLQRVYPAAREHGGPGRFATRPAMRLTERDAAAPGEARARLLEAWLPYWDTGRRLLLEKSPPNLVKLRWLQACFPGAAFVVIVRHPIPVALAAEKWDPLPRRLVSRAAHVRNWSAAHDLLLADAPLVRNVLALRYEDLVADPARELGRVCAFLGVPPLQVAPQAVQGANARYLERWRSADPPAAWAAGHAAAVAFDASARRFGYGLRRPADDLEPAPDVRALLAGRRADPAPAG